MERRLDGDTNRCRVRPPQSVQMLRPGDPGGRPRPRERGSPMVLAHRPRPTVQLLFALLLVASAGWMAPALTLAQEPPTGLDRVVAVSTNACHSLVLRADGTVWGWGCN